MSKFIQYLEEASTDEYWYIIGTVDGKEKIFNNDYKFSSTPSIRHNVMKFKSKKEAEEFAEQDGEGDTDADKIQFKSSKG